MTTPRQIKASEVVKGMRVRIEQRFGHPGPDETSEAYEGRVVSCMDARIEFPNGTAVFAGYDHPVTVLADPEPEWVEGAWYRCRVNMTGDGVKLMRRGVGGWTSFEAGPWTYQDAAVTVLGRVLVVDWPGDDLAARLTSRPSPDTVTRLLADAIHTQGGVQ